MESRRDLDIQILAQRRLPIDFEPVIKSRTCLAVVMNPVERVSEIKPCTIFVSTRIRAVIIRHHVCSVEKPVAYTHIPIADIKFKLATSREDIMTYELPVMLHGLKPA